MKITFVVPTLNLSGGLRVVAVYADQLQRMGHDVSVYSPGPRRKSLRGLIKHFIFKNNRQSLEMQEMFFKNCNFNVVRIKGHRKVEADDFPDSDVVIATFWNTAEWVIGYPKQKGKKIYLVQHYETHPWIPYERVVKTYEANMKTIAVSEWIKEKLIENHSCSEVIVITNAVDHLTFYPDENRSKNEITTFGMMYSNRAYKRSKLAIESFLKIHESHSAVRLLAYGVENIDDTPFFRQSWVEYVQTPQADQLRQIYNCCDAWLFTSEVEGFGLPILESMACATPVIATDAGAARELINSGGGILCDNESQLVPSMLKICSMSGTEWHSMSSAAVAEALKHSWNDKAKEFEDALCGEFDQMSY